MVVVRLGRLHSAAQQSIRHRHSPIDASRRQRGASAPLSRRTESVKNTGRSHGWVPGWGTRFSRVRWSSADRSARRC